MTTRRQFLQLTAGAAGALLAPTAFAGTAPHGERVLRFYNLHTGEHLKATYWADGAYVPEELAAVNYVLRDFRSGDVAHMDRRLLDLLYALQYKLQHPGTFDIISGYRSPATNAELRRTTGGVAKHSLHMEAKAADIRMPGVALAHLRRAALSLHAGGVGYYPDSDFVHVDTGRPRFW